MPAAYFPSLSEYPGSDGVTLPALASPTPQRRREGTYEMEES